jgi:hypothetical protein
MSLQLPHNALCKFRTRDVQLPHNTLYKCGTIHHICSIISYSVPHNSLYQYQKMRFISSTEYAKTFTNRTIRNKVRKLFTLFYTGPRKYDIKVLTMRYMSFSLWHIQVCQNTPFEFSTIRNKSSAKYANMRWQIWHNLLSKFSKMRYTSLELYAIHV